MELYLSIALGGSLGALTRYGISTFFEANYPSSIPWGTMLANLIGSFLIGMIFIILQDKFQQNESLRGLLIIGFLGAMTTFSSFSLEALLLLQRGHYTYAIGYVLFSVVFCLSATLLGMYFARSWI